MPFSIIACRTISGVVGIEGGFDKHCTGRAGEESVMVNNQGFRQTGKTRQRTGTRTQRPPDD